MREQREWAEAEVEEAGTHLEREIDDLEHRTDKLGEHVDEVRRDWERKREDPAVPGAPPRDPEDADGGGVAGDWEGEGPAANEAGQ